MGQSWGTMTKDQLVFAIDWFELAIKRDANHDQVLYLDCQMNKVALEVLQKELEFQVVTKGIDYANRYNQTGYEQGIKGRLGK